MKNIGERSWVEKTEERESMIKNRGKRKNQGKGEKSRR